MKVLGQAALLVGTLSALFAVNVTPARAQPSIPPRMACEALAGVDLSAELGTPARINAAAVQAENRPAPVCHLSGTIRGTIGFEAWLPLQRWTGRYLEIGCGGLCGRVSTAAPQTFGCLPYESGEFAMAATDMGHTDPSTASWGGDPERRTDFAERAQHLTARAAKLIVARLYGQGPRCSYFSGCSDGRREGLMEAMLHPEDFDGIAAGTPEPQHYSSMRRNHAMSARILRAAIVGGGIGGLSAANALLRCGIQVSVFERAEALGEVGAGVFIYPNSLRQLERMGFGPALAKVGGKIGLASRYCRMDGTVVGQIATTDSSGWNGMYGMHRADLLNALAAGLPQEVIHTGHRCTALHQDGNTARLEFENGNIAEFDVVIAADGIQSVLQKYVVESVQAEYSGSRAYRGLIARDKLPNWREEAHQVWMGDGKHFMVFPVRSGQLLNYVGFVPTANQTAESWSAVGDRHELAASFAGWEAPVAELLSKVESCFWWGLYDRRPLATWTKGRLTLLGDAAHPMLPHLGQGANQAIEDGIALAVLLEGRDPAEVPEILPRYEALRRARTDVIQAEARRNGLRYDSRSGSLEQRDREIANSARFRRQLYDYDIEAAAIAFREGKETPAELEGALT